MIQKSCRFFDRFGVCVGNCSLRESGVCLRKAVVLYSGCGVVGVKGGVGMSERKSNFPTHVGVVTEKNAKTGKYEDVAGTSVAIWQKDDGWMSGNITMDTGKSETKIYFKARKA